MRNLFLPIACIFILSLISCNNTGNNAETTSEATEAPQKVDQVKDGVFIHLSSGPENPQRVLMALSMAKMMSEDKDVLLYIDIKGIFTILNDAPDITFKEFPSSHTLLNELKEKGVSVIACPGCLKAAEKTPEDVMDWVQIATKDKFFSFCDGRIISIDY